MALQAVYQQFLASPSSSSLADDAAIYYITTTTTVRGATEIIKHFASQRQQITKKKELLLSAVESDSSLAVEIDTTILFLTGGSIYLPGLDDNFLADHTVHLPIVHFVSFNADGKIGQVRQCWDQGALLKQIDVIGKSGRNWPIRDSAEQTKLIASAVSGVKNSAPPSKTLPIHPRGKPASATRDPHASLDLFVSNEERASTVASVVSPYGGVRPPQRDITEIISDNPNDTALPVVVSPYAGRRPPQRSLTDILTRGDDENDDSATDADSSTTGSSQVIAPKAGSHKKFQPVRLFDTDGPAPIEEEQDSLEDPNKSKPVYRPNPKRYNHFDLAAGTQDAPQNGTAFDELPKSKHNSQWAFSDFETPQKPAARNLPDQEARHWTFDDDEELPETPSATSRAESRQGGRQRGVGPNEGQGLYENNLYKEDGSAFTPGPESRALGNITNLKDRTKFFEANFTMSDVSPLKSGPVKRTVVADDRQKVVKMMESSWDNSFDDTTSLPKNNNIPGTIVAAKESDSRGIQTFGDGMGGRKAARVPGTTAADQGSVNRGIQTFGDGMGGRKVARVPETTAADQGSVNRGIQIGGDGMGGRKAGRGWSLGGDGDEPSVVPPKMPGKKQGTANQASSFWDF
ncbi:hypothetical protein CMQ_6367 [Grosmannia clavigera kw1407]|uniref:Ntf2-like protein n=1 Tax=Grosmannia clavigera (strain kw1407 / UAMH 11150) TaxID=655863 RepID=F0XLJ5_GROCL|nr:uncharacterized protein CMQ_6367 [Grosmannia clavigera kw1407]EFX01425.1 hypothetical protein CMQ_6367 [Grosmannia clavigera kw1407]